MEPRLLTSLGLGFLLGIDRLRELLVVGKVPPGMVHRQVGYTSGPGKVRLHYD